MKDTEASVMSSGRPVALAWSGGKDSSLALAALRADPAVEVVALLTTVTRDFDRISMHGVRRSILAAQVDAIGLPLVEAPAHVSRTPAPGIRGSVSAGC
jgi:diphthamide synthase (EF-2-diphthine--ammonia ligase)